MFFTSALDGDEWSASCPEHFTPKEDKYDPGWVLKPDLDPLGLQKNTLPHTGIEPPLLCLAACSPVLH
jgi:hypothetical protein